MEIERLGENKIRCALSEEEIREMGYNIDEIIGKIGGIRCGSRATSCPDQLSKALRQIKAREEKAQ